MLSKKDKNFNIINEKLSKSFNKDKYDNLINEYYDKINKMESYEYRCTYCHRKCCIKHSYYIRTIKIGHITLLIRILRIKCKECGKTHAIMPMFIVPYKRVPRDIIIVFLKATNKEIKDLNYVTKIHNDIIQNYKLDFTKYEEENHKLKISKIYDLIPAELNSQNKRFNFKSVSDNFIYDRGKDNFLWLTNAGVAIPVYNINEPMIPLLLNSKNSLFKLFLSDVGLLSTFYGKPFKFSILNSDDSINFGAIYENVVAQELNAHGFKCYYYSNRKLGELDFVIEYKNKVLPLGIKSGKDYTKHSALNNILNTSNYNINNAFVLSNYNVSSKDKIIYYPIYMIMFIDNEEDIDFKIDIDSIKF